MNKDLELCPLQVTGPYIQSFLYLHFVLVTVHFGYNVTGYNVISLIEPFFNQVDEQAYWPFEVKKIIIMPFF